MDFLIQESALNKIPNSVLPEFVTVEALHWTLLQLPSWSPLYIPFEITASCFPHSRLWGEFRLLWCISDISRTLETFSEF